MRVGWLLIAALAPGCGDDVVVADGGACQKDTDCKGARICQKGQCVDPPRAASDGGTDGGDGGPVALLLAPIGDGGAPRIVLPGAAPMLHLDWAHTGRSKFRGPQKEPKEVARIATDGAVVGQPAIGDDGTAYFGSHDRQVRAASLDAAGAAALRWTRPTQDLVWCSPALGPGGALYVGSDDDHLYALDAGDGSVRWSFQAGPCRKGITVGPESSRCDVDAVTIGPDGTIYLAADGAYALKPDGTLRFRFALKSHCAGAPAVGPDGTVYVGCQDGALYALGPDGTKRWEFRTGGDVDSAPAVGDDGTVYFGSDDRKLYALGAGGALKWAVQAAGDIRGGPALAQDGTVYAGALDGGLYAVRPSGTVAWTFRAADRIAGSPAVDGAGVVLFGSQDDRLYAVTPDGKLLWSVLLGGDVDGTPAVGPNGAVYVGADDKALHILR
jgi:outer membrane protein assembly factor BamB